MLFLAAEDHPLFIRVVSQPHERRICLSLGLRTCPGTTIARVGLPSCVTPVNTLTAPEWGRALGPTLHPEGIRQWDSDT